MIKFYNAENIDELDWPETEEGQFAKKFLLPLVKDGVEPYFENIRTQMNVIVVDGHVLPITINDCEPDNSYVCSSYSYYVGYGLSATGTIKNKILKNSVKTVIKGLGVFLKVGKVDKAISINNWLFSTNIHPHLTDAQIANIQKFMSVKFPDHAIIFRSINTFDPNSPIHSLKNNQFDLIATRQVFFTDTKQSEVFKTRIFKSDLKLLGETKYQMTQLNDYSKEDLSKILSLYNALYVDKYSAISPKPKEEFLKLAIDTKLFNFNVLKIDGRIDGIVGHYSMRGIITSPFFGYDTTLPQNLGLYRLLSTVLSLEAKNSGHLFHQSSGASFYKSVRKAVPSIEYNAVYTKHLSKTRRFYWKALKFIINFLGIPWMKKY